MALPILRVTAPTDESALHPRVRQIALHAAYVLTEHSVRELRGVFAENDAVFADRERLIDEARD
jgi:hypothetical protein